MNWLAFIFALEAGFQSHSELLMFAPGWDPASIQAGYQIQSPYITLEAAGELFDFLTVGGSSKIYMADVSGWTYAPYDARLGFYVMLRRWGFILRWDHECIHPLDSPDRPDFGFLFGGGDQIYIRYEAKIRPRKR